MTAGSPHTGRPRPAPPAVPVPQASETDLIEVTFTPPSPQLTPGAARAILAMLLHARDRVNARNAGGVERT